MRNLNSLSLRNIFFLTFASTLTPALAIDLDQWHKNQSFADVQLDETKGGSATIVFIDPVNGLNDTGTSGETQDPFRSITFALAVIDASIENEDGRFADPIELRLRPGSYDSSTIKPPDAREIFPIFLRPGMSIVGDAPREEVIIDGQFSTSEEELIDGNEAGTTAVTLSNISLLNSQSDGVHAGATNFTMTNCILENPKFTGIFSDPNDGATITISNSQVLNVGDNSNGIFVDSAQGLEVLIQNVQVRTTGDPGNCIRFDHGPNANYRIFESILEGAEDTGLWIREESEFRESSPYTLTFENSDATQNGTDGILAQGPHRLIITNSRLDGNGNDGIESQSRPHSVSLFNTTISNNGRYGYYQSADNQWLSSFDVDQCIFSGNGVDGMYFPNVYTNSSRRVPFRVENSVFDNNGESAVDLATTPDTRFRYSLTFRNNTTFNNGGGPLMRGDDNSSSGFDNYAEYLITGNMFFDDGLTVAGDGEVVGNVFADAGIDVFYTDNDGFLFEGNVVSGGRFFGRGASSDRRNAILQNNFFIERDRDEGEAVRLDFSARVANNTIFGAVDRGINFNAASTLNSCFNNIISNTLDGIRINGTPQFDISFNNFDDSTNLITRNGQALGDNLGFIELTVEGIDNNRVGEAGLVGTTLTSGAFTADPTSDAASNQTTFVDGSKSWQPDQWKGAMLRIDPQGFYLPIISNTANSLTVMGQLSRAPELANGTNYRIDDYRLSTGSLNIDGGKGGPGADYYASPRPQDVQGASGGDGSNFDIGAHEFPGVPPGDRTLMVGTFTSICENSFSVPLSSTGDNEIDAFGVTVNFDPQLLQFDSVEPGAQTLNWQGLNASIAGEGQVIIGGFSGDAAPVSGSSELATLNFTCIGCDATTVLSLTDLTDDVRGYTVNNGSATCGSASALGDVNGDGQVTPGDAQLAFDFFLGDVELNPEQRQAANLCGEDGSVTPGDAQGIFNTFLGVSEPCE